MAFSQIKIIFLINHMVRAIKGFFTHYKERYMESMEALNTKHLGVLAISTHGVDWVFALVCVVAMVWGTVVYRRALHRDRRMQWSPLRGELRTLRHMHKDAHVPKEKSLSTRIYRLLWIYIMVGLMVVGFTIKAGNAGSGHWWYQDTTPPLSQVESR